MKKLIFVVCVALFFSSGVNAATLESIVKAFATPSGESYSANDWSSINSIKGIKWSHKGFRETPSSPFTRSGKVKIDNLGLADITFSGVRTMVEALHINIDQPMTSDEYKSLIASLFPATVQINTIRNNCKDEGSSLSTGVYTVTLPSTKPVYVFVESSSGASGMEGTTSFDILLEPEDRWKCS